MRKSKIRWVKKYNEYRVDLIRYYESTRLTMEIIYDTAKLVAELHGIYVDDGVNLLSSSDKKQEELYHYGEKIAVFYIESHPTKWFVKNRYLCNRKRRYLALPKEKRLAKVKQAMIGYPWKAYVRTEIFKHLQK